jgi:hypothetical protein
VSNSLSNIHDGTWRDKVEHKVAFLLVYQYKLERSGMRFDPFHGGNRGSNPLGRANDSKKLGDDLRAMNPVCLFFA